MRLRQLALVAKDLEPVVEELCAVLGVEVAFRDKGIESFGLHNALLALGDTFLEVVSPIESGTTAGRLLERRGGDGGYMVIVQVDGQVDGQELELAVERKRLAAHGVRIVWDAKLDDVATIHLHPRDVGAAILSLDVAIPPEAWHWAGPAWIGAADPSKAASRDTIESAVLQSGDPVALARRWSEVLDCKVVDANGTPSIPLDRGTLQFVPDTDGRGDGLAAMSICVSDRGAGLEAARARGLPVDQNVVTIAGTRIQLSV